MKRFPVLLAALLVLASCSSDAEQSPTDSTAAAESESPTTTSTTAVSLPPPLEDQTPPPSVNGLVVDEGTIWAASVRGDVVVQIDASTGAILQRVQGNGAGPDDVEIGPDGNVYYTGFLNGDIGVIEGGEARVVATIEPGANPLGFTSDGTLYVGRAVNGDALYRIPSDGSPPEQIATDLGSMNAFVVTGDDQILGPVQDGDSGAVIRVDPTDGSVEQVVSGLPPVFASADNSAGDYFVLASGSGEVIEVDTLAGTFSTASTLASPPYDNLAFGEDDTLYVSHFTTPEITVISPDGSRRTLMVGSAG